jgi:predicted ATPase
VNGDAQARSRLRLCGGLRIEVDGRDVTGAIPAGQCRTLVAYLAVRRDARVSREEAAETLWPERAPRDPQAVLSTLLSRVRTAIAPGTVTSVDGVLGLELPEPVIVDVEAAERGIAAARAAAAVGDWPAVAARAGAALVLLEGDLLPGWTERWVEELRRGVGDLVDAGLELVATSGVHVDSATFDAERAARALVAREPFRESGRRVLMQLLARRGDVAEALRTYEELRVLLREELGTTPSADLQTLYRELLGDAAHEDEPAAAAREDHLPPEATSFVGRAADVAWIAERLRAPGCLTITGAGGMGKTRVALRAARALASELPGGSRLVELAPLADPDLVVPAAGAALGVRVAPGDEGIAELATALGDTSMCIVLDNCEHVLAAASRLAAGLGAGCPQLRILATSREPLGFPREQAWALPPLAEADESTLFATRARAAAPDFRMTDEVAATVERLCRRLDGMPLAIELAAGLVRSLDVHAIEARLDDRFRLSMRAPGEPPERHRTLHALVDWSHALLGERERLVLRRLGAFRDGFTLEAAEAVCDAGDVLDELLALVAKSLVVKSEHGGRARYGLLETIRRFAEDRLEEAGERRATQARHRAYFADLAEASESEVGGSQRELLDRLDADLGNFRAAMARALEDGDPLEEALRIAGALFVLWYLRGRSTEGRRWLEAAAAAHEDDSALCAKALQTAGELAREQGDLDRARELLEAGVAAAQAAGVDGGFSGTAYGLFNLGIAAAEQGDPVHARELLERSLAILERDGEAGAFRSAWPLLRLGELALDEGDLDRAQELIDRSLAAHRRVHDGEGVARALDFLARTALARGERDAARLLADESLRAARDLGYEEGVWGPLLTLARVGERGAAERCCAEALAASTRIGSRRGVAAALQCAATTADPDRALRLLGAAQALRADIGAVLPGHVRAEHEACLARARGALDAPLADAAWTAGSAMTAEDAGRLVPGA